MDIAINIKVSFLKQLWFYIKSKILFKFVFSKVEYNKELSPPRIQVSGALKARSGLILRFKRIYNKKLVFYKRIFWFLKKEMYEVNIVIATGEVIHNKTKISLSMITMDSKVNDKASQKIFENTDIYFRAVFGTDEGVLKSKYYKVDVTG